MRGWVDAKIGKMKKKKGIGGKTLNMMLETDFKLWIWHNLIRISFLLKEKDA